MKKISVTIAGRHLTSITLEEEFYVELRQIARERQLSLNALITEIDAVRTHQNLCSALRVYVLEYLKQKL